MFATPIPAYLTDRHPDLEHLVAILHRAGVTDVLVHAAEYTDIATLSHSTEHTDYRTLASPGVTWYIQVHAELITLSTTGSTGTTTSTSTTLHVLDVIDALSQDQLTDIADDPAVFPTDLKHSLFA